MSSASGLFGCRRADYLVLSNAMAERGQYNGDRDPESARREQRVTRLVLPVSLIREMDRLLLDGIGGFTTRNEFVREAVEAYILELTHEAAPEEPGSIRDRAGRQSSVPSAPMELPGLEARRPVQSALPHVMDAGETAVAPLPADAPAIKGQGHVTSEPLFGMHNRDFPSIWVARQLVDYLGDGAISFEEFTERATEQAWAFADGLRTLEHELGQKLTALFPTNAEKRQTASSAFRIFAIGTVTENGGALNTEGPLFLWRVIDVAPSSGGVVVGLTAPGRELLERLAGLTVLSPHEPEHARIFLSHLRAHAPADWWGFEHALTTVSARPTRAELIERFRAAQPSWRDSVAATNAQGYVARAREWGLIAPKVLDGHYELTELGAELLKGAWE
jgi:hypothetical protein